MNYTAVTYCTIGGSRFYVVTRPETGRCRTEVFFVPEKAAGRLSEYRLIFTEKTRSIWPVQDHLRILVGLKTGGLSYLRERWVAISDRPLPGAGLLEELIHKP